MIRMIDIAREAGVSRTTVSFILNGRNKKDVKISEAVVKKVQETAERMGYIRNELANSMSTGRNRTIAVITDFRGFMIPALRGCVEEAMKHNCNIQFIAWDPDDINRSIRRALEFRVAGICLLISMSEQELERIDPRFAELGIPSVGLDRETRHMPFNQKESAAKGTEFLIDQGHRRIVFLASESDIGKEREEGYREVMRNHQLDELVQNVNLEQNISDYPAVIDWKPEAVQCADDSIAMDFLHFCYLRKYYVPECFSLLGFGNIEACSLASPRVASVDEPYYETGRLRFRQIYQLIEKKKMTTVKPLVGKVMRRESVRRRIL